ncbi:hypothetical protein D9M68_898820 [compost metagenome]
MKPILRFCFIIIQLPTKERHILNGCIPVGTVWIRLPELRQDYCLVGLYGIVEVLIQTECFGLCSPTRLVVFLLCPVKPDLAALIALREISKNHHAHLNATLPVNHQHA